MFLVSHGKVLPTPSGFSGTYPEHSHIFPILLIKKSFVLKPYAEHLVFWGAQANCQTQMLDGNYFISVSGI